MKDISLNSYVNLLMILFIEVELGFYATNVALLTYLLKEYIVVHNVIMMCIKNAQINYLIKQIVIILLIRKSLQIKRM